MAENLTIARPYAQAAFEIARQDKTFDSWSKALEALSCAMSHEQFAYMISEASTHEAAAKLLIELLGDLLDEKAQNFVYVIGENNRFEVLPEICQEFIRLRDDFMQVRVVEIVTARPLAKEDEQAIVAKLEARYKVKVNLTRTIDPSIMGGVIIRIGDEVIDGSVKTNLSRLSSTLK
ncbi:MULTISPECIES: F0F1 ATP synthase subunit delta [unclassified Anaerobiospirillum]|uniref:F0F1 ATP synthase subunit delta n=1 Tax=unclassified Anaerobiospirillum TaxID=2647410 RepID=UPI001FF2FB89|nr:MULTISPECIES: F0F1 ATP synthase subunit delta [unclassified Anaerobiospirillum]MCK0525485.1 F0F1 ATP synthase subunit delta [Anaerobiospirillum sp. NML120449]MCK0534098.1 F0F1 ATP synthase subunit delta [Anaerobiospirillum sp. NML120511]MCK0539356.1 F0F1 ATP synthase subunit delta [Anaerobiospirillum sp. NML02-A-032]